MSDLGSVFAGVDAKCEKSDASYIHKNFKMCHYLAPLSAISIPQKARIEATSMAICSPVDAV